MSVPFTIDFTAPDAPDNLTVANQALLYDKNASAHLLTWDAVPTAPENIVRIEIWLLEEGAFRRIAVFTDPAVTSYLYPFPPANKTVQYQIHQIVRTGPSTQQVGLWAVENGLISPQEISLVSVVAPTTRRVVIDAWSTQRETLTQTQEWQIPAGGSNYVEMAGSLRGRDLPLSGRLYDRHDASGITAEQLREAMIALFDTRDVFCVRDARGHKLFGRFNGNVNFDYGKGGVRYEVDFNVRRVAYSEGA